MNPDISPGNVMYDPQTRRVSWIDHGIAQKKRTATTGDIETMRFKLEMLKSELHRVEEVPRAAAVAHKPEVVPQPQLDRSSSVRHKRDLATAQTLDFDISRASTLLKQSALQLKKDQKELWQAASGAGKGHLSKKTNRGGK